MNLEEKIKESKDSMIAELDGINIEDLKSEGVSVRIGDRLLKFSFDTDKTVLDIEVIKKEFRSKLNEQQTRIKKKINQEIEKINGYHNSLKIEMERKEKILTDKLKDSTPMPNITFKQAQKGLSLSKGNIKGVLCWLVSGVYWPKFYDFKPLDIKFTKRLLTHVVYMVTTKDNYVTQVSTRKPLGLDYFEHYHQRSPDCWGKWNHKKEWNTPEDILIIGREAESILENINSGSVADNSPSGLPRISTVKKFIVDEKTVGNLSSSILRQGITTDIRDEDESVWSL